MAGLDHTALLLIDVINAMDFDSGEALLRRALPMGRRLARLKRSCKAAGLPVIYANDNYGQWRSDFKDVVRCCQRPDSRGAPLARLLAPDDDDYFVLKPEQSAFFLSPLEHLLRDLDVRNLIVTGVAGDGCVLATAMDANMRGFGLRAPSDCIESASAVRHRRAVGVLQDAVNACTDPSSTLRELAA